MKRAINLFKRLGRAYMRNLSAMYGPVVRAGVNPWT